MSKYRITNLLFSSSATIYTNAKRSFLKEDSKLKHINPYWNIKINSRNIIRGFV